MDKHFLEFWGNYLTNAAKGQKQLEEMAQWMGQGLRGFEYLTTLFRKSYGLDRMEEDSPDYLKAWKKAERDFRRSFKTTHRTERPSSRGRPGLEWFARSVKGKAL